MVGEGFMSKIAVDLFSGCGGLTEGLKQAGWKVCAAIEYEKKSAETYRLNHPEVCLIQKDISSLDFKSVVTDIVDRFGAIDLVAGCPPCQGFSRLRTKNGRGPQVDGRNELIFSMLDFIQTCGPKAVMLENVPGLLRDDRLQRFCEALRAAGYQLIADELDVYDYGVAQRRSRAILLAVKGNRAPCFGPRVQKRMNVRDLLENLEHPIGSSDDLHAIPEKRTERVSKFIRMVPKDGGSRKDVAPEFQLACHRRTSGYSDVYGRMAWDQPSPTITSGCSNPSKGRFLHPERHSAITLREAALLQGFPRQYRFLPSHGKESIALMVGNALPPPFIAIHAKELLGACERA